MKRTPVALLALALFACDDDTEASSPTDAQQPDAVADTALAADMSTDGPPDAAPDAATPDAAPDAATPDAAPDAALPDAATPDAGPCLTPQGQPGEPCADRCVPPCPAPAALDEGCGCWLPPPGPAKGPAVGDTLCLSARVPTGSGEAADARRAFFFDALRQMGIKTLRQELRWANIEPARGDFRFDDPDQVIRLAAEQGIETIGLLGYGNTWASEEAAAHNDPFYPPDDPADFATFAAAMAARYQDVTTRWEIWNEQNAGYRFWLGTLSGDPTAYAALLAATHEAVHAALPSAVVSFGGVFYVPQIIMGGESFTEAAFDALPELASHLDAYSFHPYDWYPPVRRPEFQGPLGSVALYAVDEAARRLRALLTRRGASEALPLWVTEIGWPTENAVTEEDQARYIVRSALLLASEGVEYTCFYTFWDGDPARDYLAPWERVFGLFEYDADPLDGPPRAKPAVRALGVLSRTLGDARLTERLTWGEARIYRYLTPDGRELMAVWHPTEAVPVALPARAGLVYSLVDGLSGDVQPMEPDADGRLNLEANPTPQYISGIEAL